ncbi:hypothetical protein [Luteirhabdus pelagi]|uniref:hypothetical protein n=1 Tax=Luteirhabdus pelagi TaxID=2792783 RepID=UPI001939AD9D|nr:hypothetical protein [Luteirhabdus pelagi]
MYPIYYFKKLTKGPFLALIATLLVSCGTYNEDYYDSDGIYNDGQQVSETETPVDKTNYYKQYFQTKAAQYQDVPEEDVIFTDIEAYSTTEYIDDEGYIITEDNRGYEESYGAWGSNAQDVTVNIYNDNWGWGFGYWNTPYWGFNSFWGYPYGFYRPWGTGFGWGWGWGQPFYGGFYGYGWGHPFYGNYGGYYPFYYNHAYNQVAYNRGRRNTDYIGRSSARSARRDYSRGRSNSYSRSEMARRSNRSSTMRSRSSMSRNRNANMRRSNSRSVRRTNPNMRRNNTTVRRSNSARRSSNNARRSNNSVRRSGSSGSSIRSGGSSRSSGSSRSGGGARRGGGRG